MSSFWDVLGLAAPGIASALSARNQMRFQERMRNTEVQARAKDLEAAGFNRMLAVGDGASSPQGAGFEFPDIASSAASLKRTRGELQQIGANVKLTEAQARKADAETKLIEDGRIPGGLVGTRGLENLKNAFSWVPGLAGNLREYLAGKSKDILNADAIRRNKALRRRIASSAKQVDWTEVERRNSGRRK